MLRALAQRFFSNSRGNVATIFALSIIPVIFLTGMALDFTSATQKRIRLNAAADAAALAAVTPNMMTKTTSAAKTAAQNIFKAEASTIANLNYSAPTVTITTTGTTRTVSVTYTASSINSFPNVLGLFSGSASTTWPISGASTATSSTSPNINFYLLLDNSPSMAIAATTAGVNTMVANTSSQGGCAFACHEANPSADGLGNPGGEDNYTLAANLGVTTRIQNVATAVSSLATTASNAAAANNATYKMAIYTFNQSGINTIQSLTSNMTTAGNAASNIDVVEVYQQSYFTKTNNNDDSDTDFDTAMSAMNSTSIMPNPGTGSSSSTPQGVLMIVTDGVDDKQNTTCTQPLVDSTRCQEPFNTTWCTTVKNRGIRIAILYTVYLPLPTNSWYNSYIAPFSSQISTNLQSCASTGLFFSVTTDGDITSALQALFSQAIYAARLTQ